MQAILSASEWSPPRQDCLQVNGAQTGLSASRQNCVTQRGVIDLQGNRPSLRDDLFQQ
jgi:hypothetical protein